MTPAQHKTAAESLLTSLTSGAVVSTDADYELVKARAAMSRAAGTGSHYTAADGLLAEAEAARGNGAVTGAYAQKVRDGLAHALLADL